jgi:hypothetical protein
VNQLQELISTVSFALAKETRLALRLEGDERKAAIERSVTLSDGLMALLGVSHRSGGIGEVIVAMAPLVPLLQVATCQEAIEAENDVLRSVAERAIQRLNCLLTASHKQTSDTYQAERGGA